MTDTTTRRTGVTRRYADSPLMTFGLVTPSGRLASVIEAEDMQAAWTIATGWGDARDIADRQAAGWRVVPVMIEWEDEE